MFKIIIAIIGFLYAVFGTQTGDRYSAFIIGGLCGLILGEGVEELRKK